jgi:hypothetical protein
MAHPLGRRRLERGHPGVGRQRRIAGEAPPRAEDPGERRRREQVDAADGDEGRVARRLHANLGGEFAGLLDQELAALRQAAHRGGALLLARARVGGGVGGQRPHPLLRLEARDPRAIIRIALAQEPVQLIAQARGLGDDPIPLADEQVHDPGLVVGRHRRERRRLAPDDERHGVGVEAVALRHGPRPPTPGGGPARVHLVDGHTRLHQPLRQAATVVPGPLDAPAGVRVARRRPRGQLLPARDAVRAAPARHLAPRRVNRDRHLDAAIRRSHPLLPKQRSLKRSNVAARGEIRVRP